MTTAPPPPTGGGGRRRCQRQGQRNLQRGEVGQAGQAGKAGQVHKPVVPVPLSQEARDKDKQKQRKVCPVNLRGEVCMADNCGSKHPKVCLVADVVARGRSPRPRAHSGTLGSQGETPSGTATTTTTRTNTSSGSRRSAGPRSSRRGSGQLK
jgi:hypothetical protein